MNEKKCLIQYLQQHQQHELVEQALEHRVIVLHNVEDKLEDSPVLHPIVEIDEQHELELVRIG